MKVTYNGKAEQWPEGYEPLKEASKLLEGIRGPFADPVTAEWDRTEDSTGGTLYTLRLRDATAEVMASFCPADLKFPAYMRASLYRLWGDLLQVYSDVQHRKVMSLVGQLEGS